MALKKEGTLIPKVLTNCINLSIQLSLNLAETIPKNTPKIIAMVIDDNAKTIVLGNVSEITALTFFPFF